MNLAFKQGWLYSYKKVKSNDQAEAMYSNNASC